MKLKTEETQLEKLQNSSVMNDLSPSDRQKVVFSYRSLILHSKVKTLLPLEFDFRNLDL